MQRYLSAKELVYALNPNLEEKIEPTDKWQTLLVLRRHLNPLLRMQYLLEEDPTRLSAAVKALFQHEETIVLPQARND